MYVCIELAFQRKSFMFRNKYFIYFKNYFIVDWKKYFIHF